MIATMVARLLEGAPATATTKAAAADPVVGAVLGAMDPQQAIVAGGGALLADSDGYPWNGRYIVASGTLQADGLETTVAPNALFEEEYAEHATAIWHLSDGTSGQDGSWATGLQPDGQHEFGHLADPQPLGDVASVAAPDPLLYATYDGAHGRAQRPGPGHRIRPHREDQGRPELDRPDGAAPPGRDAPAPSLRPATTGPALRPGACSDRQHHAQLWHRC